MNGTQRIDRIVAIAIAILLTAGCIVVLYPFISALWSGTGRWPSPLPLLVCQTSIRSEPWHGARYGDLLPAMDI